MRANTPVRLTKLSAENPGPVPLSYWLEGVLLDDLAVDRFIHVGRERRARQHPDEPEVVERPGLFSSSIVQQLLPQPDGSVIAVTRNSRWQIVPLRAAA